MLLLLSALLGCPVPSGPAPAPGAERQRSPFAASWAPRATNVLVVVLDDVGTEALRLYGEEPEGARTPTLAALAAEGVLFRNAYTAPTCSPARAALLTGRYARRTGVGDAISTDSTWRLSHEEMTIPEMLRRSRRPWRTAALGKWHLAGRGATDWGRDALDQGFQTHRGAPANLFTYGTGLQDASYTKYEKLVDGALSVHTVYATTDTVNDALDVIGGMGEPWLTWVAFHGAHSPFHVPPDRLVRRQISDDAPRIDQFRGMVTAVDTELGRLLRRMDPDVLSRTLIVVLGDNGTDGRVVPPPIHGREAKFTLYEAGTRVPFVVSGAGVGARGSETRALVHAVDLLPTVAQVAGVDTAALRVDLDGHSLLPLLSRPSGPGPRSVLVTERFTPNGSGPWSEQGIAVRDRRYKLMEIREEGKTTETYLFDLKGRTTDGPNLLDAPLDDRATQALPALQKAMKRFERIPVGARR